MRKGQKGHNRIDMAGKKFGKLSVIKFSHNNKGAYWICICDCGIFKTVWGKVLRNGNTKSCGCSKHSHLEKGEAGLNRLFASYKKGALDRDLEFCLSREEFKFLTKQNCHYCNSQPNTYISNAYVKGITTAGVEHGKYIYNGIDRKDNLTGYSLQNSVSCCKICNRGKSSMGYDDFVAYINQIKKGEKDG